MTAKEQKKLATISMATASALAALAGTATPAGAAGTAPDPRPGIVVDLVDGANVESLQADYGLTVEEPLVPSHGLYLMASTERPDKPGDGEKLAKELVKQLAKDARVDWAEVETQDDDATDDRFHAWPDGQPEPVGDDVGDLASQDALSYLKLDEVHNESTGRGIVVAILDTGVDADHPNLAGHLAPAGHYDFLDDDDNPGEATDGLDDDGDGFVDEAHGHGTHAAGLVAIVAPDAKILSYRVLDADGVGNPYVVALAIHDAIDSGAVVINISFGMGTKPKSKFVREAFKRAKKNNVVVVAAVGNEGSEDGHFPAHEKDVIGVAAIGRGNLDIASFSNYGKPALVAAPGEDVVSTLPGGGFGAWSGTSMAAPIVSAQAALVLEDRPDAELKKVRDIVGKSSRKMNSRRKIEKGLIDILESLRRK